MCMQYVLKIIKTIKKDLKRAATEQLHQAPGAGV